MMNTIVGREAEIRLFDEAMASPQSEFVAITGRRRIGKTFLVNRYFGSHICFYVTGIQNQPQKVQLQAFTQELTLRKGEYVSQPKNWLEAFAMLRDYLASKKTKAKKVIFFDELPWIDTQKSGFVQIFAHFWNSWAAWENNIVLVIAGSATSWIVNKIYNDTGGLHNRVTKRIWLKPFKLKETEAFFKRKNIHLAQYEIALLYMAMGGVPYYLNEIKANESAAQNIQRLFFDVNGLLRGEFNNLFQAIFSKADSHIKIIKLLAENRYGLDRNTLLKKLKMTNSGGSTKILEDLLATGYVEYLVPLGKNNNSGKYVLSDFYTLFFLKFVANKNATHWLSQIETSTYKIWCGLTFERLCLYHQEEIKKALKIEGIHTKMSHLSVKDENGKVVSQIDLLIERNDNIFNLCEIKFANDIYILNTDEASNIRKKITALKPKIKLRQSIFPTMITPFGCDKNAHYLGLIINEITLENLFA